MGLTSLQFSVKYLRMKELPFAALFEMPREGKYQKGLIGEMEKSRKLGHVCAFFVVVVWGLTFIFTKILLEDFSPVEIIVIRFVIALITLTVIRPRFVKRQSRKQEMYYAAAGLTGVALYYLLENIALSYTLSSNVGIIIATVPFFTGLLSMLVYHDKDAARWRFFIGCFIAFYGIVLISLNGAKLKLNPLGDGLTLLAALCWASYNLILKKIESFGYENVQDTKRIFAWGVVFTIPMGMLMGFSPSLEALLKPGNIALFLFLGIGACGLCYLMWNIAVYTLGPVRTNIYLFLEPVITLLASLMILREPVTGMELAGIALILTGLAISR